MVTFNAPIWVPMVTKEVIEEVIIGQLELVQNVRGGVFYNSVICLLRHRMYVVNYKGNECQDNYCPCYEVSMVNAKHWTVEPDAEASIKVSLPISF